MAAAEELHTQKADRNSENPPASRKIHLKSAQVIFIFLLNKN